MSKNITQYNIGTSNNKVATNVNGTLTITETTTTGDIVPSASGTKDIGTSDVGYKDVYGNYFSGGAYKLMSSNSDTEGRSVGGAGTPVYFSNGVPVAITPDDLVENLKLSNALHFRGIATISITDGSTEDPEIEGYNFNKKQNGDVIIDQESSCEYIWSNGGWERLGPDGSYKTLQDPINSPSTNGSGIDFISTISQNANGVIEATRQSVREASTEQSGLMTASDKTKLDNFTNTTYTFTSGTNGFTVTPSGGTAQSVVVTPNINVKQTIDTSSTTVTGGIAYNGMSSILLDSVTNGVGKQGSNTVIGAFDGQIALVKGAN